jgi:hypothetical protein
MPWLVGHHYRLRCTHLCSLECLFIVPQAVKNSVGNVPRGEVWIFTWRAMKQ